MKLTTLAERCGKDWRIGRLRGRGIFVARLTFHRTAAV